MGRAWGIGAFILVAILAFALGAAATGVYSSRASAIRLEAERSRARESADALEESRFAWQTQLLFLRAPEPAHAATAGVYLARISPDTGGATFVADWVSTDGLWSDKVHSPQGVVQNHSAYHQHMTFMPVGAVLIQAPLGPSHPGGMAPQATKIEPFFRELSSDDATGAALRGSYWWVTVDGPEQAAQLCQAPAF